MQNQDIPNLTEKKDIEILPKLDEKNQLEKQKLVEVEADRIRKLQQAELK